MPKRLDYERLPWSHPLRRLTLFRLEHERIYGGDGKWCERMGLRAARKNDWYRDPYCIGLGEILGVCHQLDLSFLQIIWVLLGDCPECQRGDFDHNEHPHMGFSDLAQMCHDYHKCQIEA